MHFCSVEITFLGHRVSKKGVAPLEDKVTAIRELSRPCTMKELRRYLGMVNFYRRFIPGVAKTLAPLHSLLLPHKHSRKNVEWNEVVEASFIAVKQQLADTTMLAFPVLNAPIQLVTDASDTAVAHGHTTSRGWRHPTCSFLFQKPHFCSKEMVYLRPGITGHLSCCEAF